MSFNQIVNTPATNITPVVAGDGYQTVVDKLQSQAIAISYAQFSNTTINNWLTNITANGGSVSPSQLGIGLYFLNGISQIGILNNCMFANLCVGNNVQAAASNLIYQSTNKYMTGIGGPVGSANFDTKRGWQINNGTTSLNTNFDVLGYSSTSFTMVHGNSTNSNNTTGNLFGFSSHGILKTQDAFGFSVVQYAGRSNAVIGGFNAIYNSTGDHVLVQGSGVLNWYLNGLLNGTVADSGSGTLPTNTLKVQSNNITYCMAFNIALTAGQAAQLQSVLDGINTLSGRNSNILNIKSIVYEGSSITSSYVPPYNEYYPKYITSVNNSIGAVDVNNTLSAQISVSGQLASQMYNNAINDLRLLNSNNFNNKQNNVIVIEPGPNDIGGATLDNADHVYDTYVVPMCRNRIAAGYTVILQTTLNACNYSGYGTTGNANCNDPALGLRRLNFRIKSDVNNYNGINAHGVVFFDEIPETQDYTNTLYFQDGLHPTQLLGTTIWSPITALEIKRAIGRRTTNLGTYQSEIPQYITADIVPSYSGSVTSYRQFKNFIMSGTFNFTLPDPMLFYGVQYILTNKSGTQTILGTISGIVNPIINVPYSVMRIRSVKTNINTFEWVSDISKKIVRTSTTNLVMDNTIKSYYYSGTTTAIWTLPTISGNTGTEYYIKNTSQTVGANITLVAQSGDQIYYTSPVSSLNIVNGSGYILQNDGTYWQIM